MPLLLIMLCVFGQQRSAQQRSKLRRTSLGEDVKPGSDSPTPEVRCMIKPIQIPIPLAPSSCSQPAGPYSRGFAFRNTEVESAHSREGAHAALVDELLKSLTLVGHGLVGT